MKSMILVALALVAAAAAAPAEVPIGIVKYEFNQQPEGSYVFKYESEDGSKREEVGEVQQVLDEENKPHDVVIVRGFYSYLGADGKVELVNYNADQAGYHPEGDSIPKVASR